MQFLKNNISERACLVLLCLLLTILSVSCVSQKPKAQEEVPEAVSEQANADNPNGASSAAENSQANAEPASEMPKEVLAMYKKSPSLKSVMAVLLLPQIPEIKALASPDQAAKAMVAPSTSEQTSATAQQASAAQAAQTSAATQPVASASQTQSPSAPQSAVKTPAATTSPAKTPAAQSSQSVTPVLPTAPASSTAAITALPPSPVPNAELSVQKNQTFSVSLPGNGWIYLGDEQNRQGIRYESRQLIDNTILYRLTGDRPGEFLLRFQRDNPVTQVPEFQYIKVTVSDAPTQSTPSVSSSSTPAGGSGTAGATSTASSAVTASAAAPASATGSAGATNTTGAASTAGTASTAAPTALTPGISGTAAGSASTVATTSAASPAATAQPVPGREAIQAMTDSAAVLELARSQLAQKQVSTVLSALERFLVLSPAGSDEVLYLYALAYEQETPYRDIQKAYQYYKTLVKEYPLSLYRQFAMERIAYLERYYPGLR